MSKKSEPAPLAAAPRCTAKSKRSGVQCRAPAVRGKTKCRMHGGKSTGARTAEGKERCRQAAFIHGFYVAENLAEWRRVGAWLREINRRGKGR
ncbi:hypothetical protein A6M27_12080 [Acidithiobacillus thiooxidans]|uniref:Uncharacterized protein n=1 Tax=Acidithiobacillus thiooxidans TaxID=930 RepID=A0A1C2IS60_ACITH|nr:hypothetical protein A6P07_15420 [Acidithiobacillus thiooxidans]OCX71728.1 hypothetical protein A6O24_15155 [Acidithiobacillus thiooxidans]OCX78866.1 hypothetical protein A6O26_17520 [Acidithiobacillus thiooxidans]OCX86655.1 hypothetical protein A6M27_12080 [Acidithiobacillus thiooxidans]OFC44924.1 hypothetical protein BAE47_11015 [Acidithiobacillus thiooxidans]